ncbi:MAG TPA: flagellar hook-length control protein FliK [Planctomycetota bacterium]|nr:flagellar hook-length control protein FliK [Planctomycetota bacterium]
MDAAMTLMSMVKSEAADALAARGRSGAQAGGSDLFADVLQQASEAREKSEDQTVEPSRSRDAQDAEADPVDEAGEASDVEEADKEGQDGDGAVQTEGAGEARDAREAGETGEAGDAGDAEKTEAAGEDAVSAGQLAVAGGINLVLPTAAATQTGDVGVASEEVLTGYAMPAVMEAEPAQEAGQATAAQPVKPVSVVKGGTPQDGDVPGSASRPEAEAQKQTLDRGAAARIAIEHLAAGAKEGSKHKFVAEGTGQSELRAAAVAGAPRVATAAQVQSQFQPQSQPQAQPQVTVPAATAELAADSRQVQVVRPAGAESSGQVQAVGGAERADVRSEGSGTQGASQAEGRAEPAVDRQRLLDQVVRSARLHMDRGLSRFEMRLDPPSLGRVKVVMDLKDGALSISFKVENQAVKDALQDGLAQLREALNVQGLAVDGVDVQGSGGGPAHDAEGRQDPATMGTAPGGADRQEPEPAADGAEPVRTGSGLVDCWA